MLVYAVDDEQLVLETLVSAIKEAVPDAEIHKYGKSSLLLKDIEDGSVPDVIFTDIEMPGLSGIELAKRIKILSPRTNIVFVTGFSDYALEALKLYPSGYVLKPVTGDLIRSELDNLRFPIKKYAGRKLIVRTFRNFEVFVDDKPLIFERNRAKEVFAYLIDRHGSGATCAEIAAVLWDDGAYDRSHQKQLQVFIHSMKKTLSAAGVGGVIIRNRTEILVDTSMIDCDAYRFADGDITAINSYCGEYMSPYSWAEFTNGKLSQILERK